MNDFSCECTSIGTVVCEAWSCTSDEPATQHQEAIFLYGGIVIALLAAICLAVVIRRR